MKNDTLKEYYVKLEGLWNNVTNVLFAINQSLHTNSSEITVQIADTDNTSTTVRIPSFLYLENKLEVLSNNFSNLFNMPKSGEAWFNTNTNNNMYKLEMVRSNTAPNTPIINTNNIVSSITDNNFLKDLVSPRTYLKLNIDNLPDNINKIFMKKYIIYNYSVFESLRSNNVSSYDEFLLYIYNLRKGIDYDEYDSILDTPIKTDVYNSNFSIIDIPVEDNNPWIDSTNSNLSKYSYKIQLDTLKYTNQEDTSIEFSLKIGDKLCLGNELTIYKVKSIDTLNNIVIIEEIIGHTLLQTVSENSEMVLKLYNDDYSKYHYVEVPLEENPYICVFLGTIYNNVRSLLSKPVLLNLNEIFITDKSGQYIYDGNGNKLNYIEYYKKECTNIGDLILGLTQSAYPQLTLLDSYKLQLLQNNGELTSIINQTIDSTNILQVVPINKHTLDNVKTEEVISLHSQKNELSSQINSINNNISTVNTKLISTDFKQEVSITYQSLKSQLDQYYNERILLQKQLISIVENINNNLGLVTGKNIKYRIRGICNTDILEQYIHNVVDPKVDIIGIDVEYKYRSINKDVTNITSINSNVFTDWNKLVTIDKQRIINFNELTNNYTLEFENYNSTNNIIKWNQIDIPIVSDEDVIIRVRYKYNIGQPFVNIYSPWSDEIVVIFPVEYKDNVEINSIALDNSNDIINAKFNSTLINDGYQEHINNSLIVSDNIFYHMPENIYSGFTNSDNKMITLKDKLLSLSSEVERYTKLISETLNQKYAVYLTYDESQVELFNSIINKVNIYNEEHIVDTFVKKTMNIVFKNTGDIPIKMYSIFPGNINIPLLLNNDEFYDKTIRHYERVPVFFDDKISYQRLGQWIYFRQNNFWTGENIYKVSEYQNDLDVNLAKNYNKNDKVKYTINSNNTIYSILELKNNQPLLGFRQRTNNSEIIHKNTWVGYDYSENKINRITSKNNNNYTDISDIYKQLPIDFFIYENKSQDNNYITKFEDICFQLNDTNIINLDEQTSIEEFIKLKIKEQYIKNDVKFNMLSNYVGAFLYPNIQSETSILTNGGINDYIEIPVGGSISIPITLEYFLNNEQFIITKSLYFDIKTSLYKEIEHYMLEIVLNPDTSTSINMISNVSLYDETIE